MNIMSMNMMLSRSHRSLSRSRRAIPSRRFSTVGVVAAFGWSYYAYFCCCCRCLWSSTGGVLSLSYHRDYSRRTISSSSSSSSRGRIGVVSPSFQTQQLHQRQRQQSQGSFTRYNTVGLNLSSSSSSSNSSGVDSTKTLDATQKPDLPPIGPSTKRLFLVRHGEVINPGGDRPVYYGAMDVPLSPLGEQEAQAAAMYLQEFASDIDLVVSSPLSRAVYGADQVMDFLSTKTTTTTTTNESSDFPRQKQTTIEGFRELDRGSWCGKTKDEIGHDAMARFDACDESVTPDGGGESYPFLKDRVLKARDEVLDALVPGRAAVVVSHLQVTRSMLSEALDIPTNEMSSLKVATASVTCIDYNNCDTGDDHRPSMVVQYQSFKPDIGLAKSKDGAN
eukprot:CAMPEP_0113484646 /NCGR_PEP_ID=MMETSP0014_2-20120614/24070_1 /TAXON_ID=2857 /ORGANISM="Nitzschia sp." /LENGTH=390 /DNA_ID=CAMNT_0000378257 /DNA_START=126 /DNA_END=1298 /DNA_ORIENTATION=- /assembly_acc=CAM_ASM_000159